MRITKRHGLLSVVLAGVLGLAAILAMGNRNKTGALAEVDGATITEEAFRYWWQHDRPATDTPETRQAVLNRLIERTTLASRARAAGLDRDPKIVEAIESLLIAQLMETELQPLLAGVEVSDEEARAYFEANPTHYTTPAQRRVAVLWFNTRGLEPLVARYQPRLEQIRHQLIQNPDQVPIDGGFGTLAHTNSEHRATRHRGGDLGWIDLEQGNDPWKNTIAQLASDLSQPGDFSKVTANDHGIFLVRLLDVRDLATRPFEEVKPQIAERLKREKQHRIEQKFFANLERDRKIVIHRDRLSALKDLPVHKSGKTNRNFTFNPNK